jgi:hypothetical protein
MVVGKVFYFLFRSSYREEEKIRLLFADGEIIFLPYWLYLGVTTMLTWFICRNGHKYVTLTSQPSAKYYI